MVGLPLGMLVGMVWRDWSLGAVLYEKRVLDGGKNLGGLRSQNVTR